jgi:hypothetical protein
MYQRLIRYRTKPGQADANAELVGRCDQLPARRTPPRSAPTEAEPLAPRR